MENSTNETKLCKHCQTEIPKKAKVCPNCRKKQGGIGKWIVIAVVVVIIIAAVAGGGSDDSTKQADSSANSESAKKGENSTAEKEAEVEYIEVTATELIDAYNENQVKCKQTYDGKPLKVRGTVQSVGTDILDSVYVCLGHDTDYTFVGIQCYAKNADVENEIAELKEGDEITVTGTGDCESLTFMLKNAEIVK